ncbi:hypothetical protein DL96DRAFT_1708356 [Flagelloscypha sp. PMI_526]|nr:hypothetical protein DL96DRAFT_1708356 [Flagelloscypha sp. PMI_526]
MDEPRLPDELEELIFKILAWSHRPSAPTLILVARHVKHWIQPILYSQIFLGDSTRAWRSFLTPRASSDENLDVTILTLFPSLKQQFYVDTLPSFFRNLQRLAIFPSHSGEEQPEFKTDSALFKNLTHLTVGASNVHLIPTSIVNLVIHNNNNPTRDVARALGATNRLFPHVKRLTLCTKGYDQTENAICYLSERRQFPCLQVACCMKQQDPLASAGLEWDKTSKVVLWNSHTMFHGEDLWNHWTTMEEHWKKLDLFISQTTA